MIDYGYLSDLGNAFIRKVIYQKKRLFLSVNISEILFTSIH